MTSDELKYAAEYHRGYEDGKKAKSADEWRLASDREEVVRRLREVKLDGGSHANLSEICKCVYHTDEWTPSACVGLRDELISLLGGNADKYAFVEYDVLGNARHKAVCRLEESKPLLGMSKVEILGDLGKAITNNPNFDPSDIDHLNLMWSDLIHLLGGDNGTCPNDVPIYADDFAMRPLPTPNRDFAKVAERSITIMSELRDLVHSAQFEAAEDADSFIAIADRIDAQFASICEQQERVLQATIDRMCEECDKLQAVIDLKDRALDAALAKLKDSIESPKDADGVPWHLGDRFTHRGKTYEVSAMRLFETGKWGLETSERDGNFNPTAFTHAHTAEEIVRDLTLGRITEKEAVKRIEELRNE